MNPHLLQRWFMSQVQKVAIAPYFHTVRPRVGTVLAEKW